MTTLGVHAAPRPTRGRHVAPAHRTPPRTWLIGSGIGSLTLLLVLWALVGRTASVSAASVQAASSAPPVALSPVLCESAVTALLGDDLAKVAAGRPDLNAPGTARVQAALGTGSPAMVSVQGVHDRLVGDATSALINRFHLEVAPVLTAYEPLIRSACAAATR